MIVRVRRDAIGAIVLDIEGTTTPIAFVRDVLFPYARRHLREHLKQHGDSAALRAVVAALRREWADDVARGDAPPIGDESEDALAVAAYVEWLMDRDRKSPPLKLLQGYIWEAGYRSGALVADVFPDVRPALARWRSSGITVAIYSSGSALAQRLLFSHTRDGDLTPYLDAFFDTAMGAKTSPASYRRIASALRGPTARLLFVSDARGELDAARYAGCRTLLSVRPGNVDQPHDPADAIASFDDVMVD
ncbi:MAG: acireductone synthase [Vicinamibacterales bacterium]